jgi:Ran GTPase-activating protein (RanGAP) involved in mRNA processing and transport
MGALMKLGLRQNGLCSAAGGQAMEDMLKNNSVLKDLDLSDNYNSSSEGDAGAIALAKGVAEGLRDNGGISVLSLKNNMLATKEAGKALAQALASNSTLKELDVSDNWEGGDGPGFAQELAVGIKDNGAMTSLNLSYNGLGVEGAKIITAVLPKCT